MANKKVKFIVSPTGTFKLAYSVGEEGTFEAKQADELIEAGYAVEVKKASKEEAPSEGKE